MNEIGVRELKSRLSETLRRVKAGESIRVTSRGRAVAVIVPSRSLSDEEIDPEFLQMEKEGRIRLSRIPKSQRPDPPPAARLKGPKTASEIIIEGRAERF